MESSMITCEYFKKRIIDLCLRSGLQEFPSKRRDQLIIIKCIANMFMENKIYIEKEVNEIIKSWLADMSCFSGWDYITLRRELVDNGFLNRNPEGSCYRLSPNGPAGITFEPAVTQIKIKNVLEEGKRMIAQRKMEHLGAKL